VARRQGRLAVFPNSTFRPPSPAARTKLYSISLMAMMTVMRIMAGILPDGVTAADPWCRYK